MVTESWTVEELFRREGGKAADGNNVRGRGREGEQGEEKQREHEEGGEETGEGLRVICGGSIRRCGARIVAVAVSVIGSKKRITVAELIWAAACEPETASTSGGKSKKWRMAELIGRAGTDEELTRGGC